MSIESTKFVRAGALVVVLAAAIGGVSCGSIESTPTSATPVGEPAPAPSPSPSPSPAPSPSPSPSPSPAPAPAPDPASAKLAVSVNPNPVPFSGAPITDVASCQTRTNTWFYDQVLSETAGVAVTISERQDSFDGAAGSKSNPNLQIPAGGSVTIRTRWCSASASAHTAQTSFAGTDANGNAISVAGPVVQLQAK